MPEYNRVGSGIDVILKSRMSFISFDT